MISKLIQKIRLQRRLVKARSRWKDDHFFEKEVFMLPFLLNGGTAIDVGANKGLYSALLSKYADKVIAFEPNPNFASNLKQCLPQNCHVRPMAVSAQTGTSKLKIPHTNSGRSINNIATLEPTPNSATHLNVKTIALDDLDEENVTFIKADVEGHEHQVLAGAKKLIKAQRPTVMMEINDPATESSKLILTFFEEQDYTALQLRNRTLVALDKEPGVLYYRNVLFLPKQGFDYNQSVMQRPEQP